MEVMVIFHSMLPEWCDKRHMPGRPFGWSPQTTSRNAG
jgi:hypothetical protein